MATPTEIVNIALRRVGANRISNLATDANKEGIVARDLYDEARRDLLCSCGWNFALKRANLTSLVSATSPTFGWDYAYPLPEDFLRLISAHPADDDTSTCPYSLEFQESDDRVILTRSNQLWIRYVWDIEDCNLMSAAFRDTLAWRLARDFGSSIAHSASLADQADTNYRRALSRAKAIDGVEEWPQQMAEGSWVTSRFADTSRG